MLLCLIQKLKSLLLGTLNLISNILCCWKRRRRNSDSVIPVSVVNSASKLVNDVAGATNWDDDDWDSCEIVIDKHRHSEPRTTSDHIAAYRQQIAAVRQNSVPEEDQQPAVDLFADMVPDIKRQRKVFVGKESPRLRDVGSRLSAQNIDPLISMGADLENWEESENAGWECNDEEMNEALRSHRRGKR